jgi:hypothetical protein
MPYKMTDLHTVVSLLTQLEPRMSQVLELLGRITGSTLLSWETLERLVQLVLLDLQGLPVLVLQEQLVRLERQVALGKLVLRESELQGLLESLELQARKERQVLESMGKLGLPESQVLLAQSEQRVSKGQRELGLLVRPELEQRVLQASKARLELALLEPLGLLVKLGQQAQLGQQELGSLGQLD